MINKKYALEDILKAVGESKSIANVLRLIGLKPKGGNYATIKKYINVNNIDVSHFTGQGHNVGDSYVRVNVKIPIEYYLIKGLSVSSHNLKKRLIIEGFKKHECEECGLCKWLDKEIPLELHHIDGDHFNNELINIQLLCPNCHASTSNYRGKNIVKENSPKTLNEMYPELFIKKEKKEKKEKIVKLISDNKCKCGRKISRSAINCLECSYKNSRKNERPDKEILLKEIKEIGYSATGRKYGVSDNSIRKWVK